MENVQSKDFSVVLLLVALALKVPQSRRHELQAKHKAGMPMHKRARVFASRAFLRSEFSCNVLDIRRHDLVTNSLGTKDEVPA